MKLLDRNRRASASLSPVLIHFISPSSYLSQKLQLVLTQLARDAQQKTTAQLVETLTHVVETAVEDKEQDDATAGSPTS